MSRSQSIDPRTVEHIRLQGYDEQRDVYRCGCSRNRDRPSTHWWLCDYHRGYDDGVEDALRE